MEQVLYEKKRSRNNCGHSLGHGHTQGNRANRTGFYSSINKEQVISYSLRGCGRESNSRQNREKDIINTKFKHTLFKKKKKKKILVLINVEVQLNMWKGIPIMLKMNIKKNLLYC